ncbi:hypothetical protein Ancab_026131 [Ancistrocladus abbreviatus]
MALILTEQQERPKLLQELSDASGESSEEDDSFCEMTDEELNSVGVEDVKSRPKYVRIVNKQRVGIYISVWVRQKLRRHINNLKVSPVGVRLMGYMGNKIFWFGDLNYRFNMLDTKIRKLVASEQWDKLMNSDQVRLRAPSL